MRVLCASKSDPVFFPLLFFFFSSQKRAGLLGHAEKDNADAQVVWVNKSTEAAAETTADAKANVVTAMEIGGEL